MFIFPLGNGCPGDNHEYASRYAGLRRLGGCLSFTSEDKENYRPICAPENTTELRQLEAILGEVLHDTPPAKKVVRGFPLTEKINYLLSRALRKPQKANTDHGPENAFSKPEIEYVVNDGTLPALRIGTTCLGWMEFDYTDEKTREQVIKIRSRWYDNLVLNCRNP